MNYGIKLKQFRYSLFVYLNQERGDTIQAMKDLNLLICEATKANNHAKIALGMVKA